MTECSLYILTNWTRSVIYVGVSSDIAARLAEHRSCSDPSAFTARYKCFHLIYRETYSSIDLAIRRERELKGWRRSKKLELIRSVNPSLSFLDESGFEVKKGTSDSEGVLL